MGSMAYVCLYCRYLQTLEPFSDAERGRIMTAMLTYAATGQCPVFEGNERFIWPTIKAQIDRDNEAYKDKCSKNQENGRKGGRPRRNQTVSEKTERLLQEPKKAKTNTNSICLNGDFTADPGLNAGSLPDEYIPPLQLSNGGTKN